MVWGRLMLALTIMAFCGCEIETHSPDYAPTYRPEYRKRGDESPPHFIFHAMNQEEFNAYWQIQDVIDDIDALKSMGNTVPDNKWDEYVDSVDIYLEKVQEYSEENK